VYLILLGAPGTGKGTQAKIIAERFGWSHVSSGDLLREEIAKGSPLGQQAKPYYDAGSLVPDELVIAMLVDRVNTDRTSKGFVFDGFPRNLAQAMALDAALQAVQKGIDLALNITAPDEELVRRLSGRWICRNCGAIYHEVTNPPREKWKCDSCGGELYQREDDKAETVRARLEKQKPPPDLIGYYRGQGKLKDVDGSRSVEAVTEDLAAAIESAS
jgi:adenylate kinase